MTEEEFSFIEKEEHALMEFCKHNEEAKDRLNNIIAWRKEFIRRLKDRTSELLFWFRRNGINENDRKMFMEEIDKLVNSKLVKEQKIK